ncbi:MAG TPA: hypothetical protein VGR89_00935, partial [Puia sp.]|nr:hypothetical protein [Puia sp.]
IYIQERDVNVGRLMIYNNWGGGMVKDPDTIWIGMEYFCNKTDALWAWSDEAIQELAVNELIKMELACGDDVLDSTVQRMEKTYPAYFGTYDRFNVIRNYTDRFANLFLIGRNGMHKYNNSDHSSLCAMVAVDNIVSGITSKANLWAINTEQEYHEEKRVERVAPAKPAREPKSVPAREPALSVLADFWKSRANQVWWIAGIIICLVEFVIFKLRYPYANYIPDSYSYIEAAATNADVNIWPVAYSKFLRLISVFTHSDKVVVGLQYLLLQGSALFFLFSLFYCQRVGRWLKGILLSFIILNPVSLYIANYISADALFIGFSLLWMSSLVWVLYRPGGWTSGAQAFLLLACFTLRYNAIYYPAISLVAFVLSRQSWKGKLAGILAALALVAVSFQFTSNKMAGLTGQRQFSAFGGWQLANNALYMYEHIPARQRPAVPARFATLDAMVRQHMDTLRRVKRTREDSINAYFYLWSPKAPLVAYLRKKYQRDSTTSYFTRWASEAPLFGDYALFLIKNFPLGYARHWMLPNGEKFAVPPTEFLGTYNMGGDSVGRLAKEWFNYKSQKVRERHGGNSRIAAMEWYPVFCMLVNLAFVVGLAGSLFLGAVKRKEYGLPQLLGLAAALWMLNCGFSVFASPIVLRYQIFPMLVFLPV